MSCVSRRRVTVETSWQKNCGGTSATAVIPSTIIMSESPSLGSTIQADTTSIAHKKARRQYLKTTKNRNKDIELDWTPFRTAEKRYKAHFPPPDLRNVLDLATLDGARADEVKRGIWHGTNNAVEYQEIGLKQSSCKLGGQKAYVIPRVPGARQSFHL